MFLGRGAVGNVNLSLLVEVLSLPNRTDVRRLRRILTVSDLDESCWSACSIFWIRERMFGSCSVSLVSDMPPLRRNSRRLSLDSSSPRVCTRSSSGGSVFSIAVVACEVNPSGC